MATKRAKSKRKQGKAGGNPAKAKSPPSPCDRGPNINANAYSIPISLAAVSGLRLDYYICGITALATIDLYRNIGGNVTPVAQWKGDNQKYLPLRAELLPHFVAGQEYQLEFSLLASLLPKWHSAAELIATDRNGSATVLYRLNENEKSPPPIGGYIYLLPS